MKKHETNDKLLIILNISLIHTRWNVFKFVVFQYEWTDIHKEWSVNCCKAKKCAHLIKCAPSLQRRNRRETIK